MQCKLYIRNNKTIKLRARSKPMPLSLHMLKTLKATLYMQTQGIIKRPYQALYSILFFLKHGTDDNNQMRTSSNQQCRCAIATQMSTSTTHSSLSHVTSCGARNRHARIQSKGTSFTQTFFSGECP